MLPGAGRQRPVGAGGKSLFGRRGAARFRAPGALGRVSTARRAASRVLAKGSGLAPRAGEVGERRDAWRRPVYVECGSSPRVPPRLFADRVIRPLSLSGFRLESPPELPPFGRSSCQPQRIGSRRVQRGRRSGRPPRLRFGALDVPRAPGLATGGPDRASPWIERRGEDGMTGWGWG